MERFNSTFDYKLIYIIRIHHAGHEGVLKIGDTTVSSNKNINELFPNCKELNQAAKKRVSSYTTTAGVEYDLLHTELAVASGDTVIKYFRDYDVHNVLMRSGYNKIKVNGINTSECFKITLESAIEAIAAVKEGKSSINYTENNDLFIPINFRPEQREAIQSTVSKLKKSNKMLWNAKMRFGKTVCTLEVIKQMGYKRTLIMSHRPVVNEGWYEDYTKIFEKKDNIYFASKKRGEKIAKLCEADDSFIYFMSIQDLRGSNKVGGKFDKNDEIFNVRWDFVVIDEAHEGTTTQLGEEVKKIVIKEDTKLLELSGTPFSILQNYNEDELYTWDYVMEQKAKHNYEILNFGDSNPYDSLPNLNIFTYNLGELFTSPLYSEIEDQAFNFKEFFRVHTNDQMRYDNALPLEVVGKFIHEKDVLNFLDLLSKESNKNNYPFSNAEYRELFKHTLWMIPGVKEGKALSSLLNQHALFGNGMFDIINVAGDGDDDEESKDALEKVRKGIRGASKLGKYTITLSCGKLTTGVTIPEWTAVFMLSGSYSTSASNYLQTIFRVQSPANIDGKMKTNCYVFDFAPDRTLKMVADAVNLSAKAGKTTNNAKTALGDFLNFCPVIGMSGSKMVVYSASNLLQQLKRAYADRAVRTGFDDTSIYNEIELIKLTDEDMEKFIKLKEIVGATKSNSKDSNVKVAANGLTEEQYEEIEKIKNKKQQDRTPEELEKLEKLAEAKKSRDIAISILRAISVRIPLLIYGAKGDFDETITIDSFLDDNIIDEESWKEFMPKGVSKEDFKEYTKYYDQDVFISAGLKIRSMVKYADTLPPTERIMKITELFKCFKNPDKETVLTPWRVVNMHMGETLGGYNFFDNTYKNMIDNPCFIDQGDITSDIFKNKNVKVLEINSKTGLYPLFITYSIFRERCDNYSKISVEEQRSIWNKVVLENIFIICKTPMAKSITERTLLGFNKSKSNMHYFEDLIGMLKNKPGQFSDKVTKPSYWKMKGNEEMKFDAVVGNPPYQENIVNRGEQPPVYHLFYDASIKVGAVVTLITPARFLFNVGKTPSVWNKKMLNDEHFKVVEFFSDSKEIFDTVDIKGGVAITIRNMNSKYGAIKTFARNENVTMIVNKVKSTASQFINDVMYSNTSYKYTSDFFNENPGFNERVSGGSARYLSSSVFDKFPEAYHESCLEKGSYIQIIGRQNSARKVYWFKRNYINPPANFEKYKVFLASSNGSGKFGEKLSAPIIGEPYVGATETFISFGSFETREEAEFLAMYLQTKFARFLLNSIKVTQGNKNSHVWSNVPLMLMKEMESKSLEEMDAELFKVFNLSVKEIDYIEKNVESMGGQ